MANSRKRISELPALSVASLDTTFVLGISGSTTYKISINNLTSSLDGAFATDLVTNALSSSLNSKLSTSSFNQYTQSFTASVASGTISGSSQISDLGFVTGSYTTINSFNSLTQSFNSISQSFNVISGSVVSIQGGFDTGSYQTFTSSVNTSISNLNTFTASVTTASIVTSISNLNTFTASISTASLVISISNLNTFTASQSTSSLVDRLNTIESISGSWITESETGSFLTSLSGAISSSTQVVGILSSLNSVSASLISKTGSYATTGSNSFNGNQTITGSVTTTGVLNVGTIGSGDEGGEIQLVVPQTNTSLTNKVIVDVFRNTLRFWEGGPNSKGVHIDLTKAPDGVAGELIWKASGMVGAGTFVTLDNLKCTITTSGNRGLSIGAVSTNFEADVSGVWMTAGGSVGASANNISYTTAASTSLFDVNFVAHGNTAQYQIRDKTNNRFYRVTMMIGISYISNFISIERLF